MTGVHFPLAPRPEELTPGDIIHDTSHHPHPGPCSARGARMGDVEVIGVDTRWAAVVAVHWRDPAAPHVTGVTLFQPATRIPCKRTS